jgi:O-antigen/teichoic acid export membrane protein
MVLSGIAVMFYMRIDQVMVEEMLGSPSLGQYSAALKLSEIWYSLMAVFSVSLLPQIVERSNRSGTVALKNLQKVFFIMIWLNVVVAIFVTLAGAWIVTFLFGEAYLEAIPVLLVHIWTGPFVALGLISGNWLIANKLQRLSLLRTLFGAMANVVFNIWLIPRHGIIGAAVASLFAQIFAALLFDLFSRQTRKIFVVKLQSIVSPIPPL